MSNKGPIKKRISRCSDRTGHQMISGSVPGKGNEIFPSLKESRVAVFPIYPPIPIGTSPVSFGGKTAET